MMSDKVMMRVYACASTTEKKALALYVFALADGVARCSLTDWQPGECVRALWMMFASSKVLQMQVFTCTIACCVCW